MTFKMFHMNKYTNIDCTSLTTIASASCNFMKALQLVLGRFNFYGATHLSIIRNPEIEKKKNFNSTSAVQHVFFCSRGFNLCLFLV